MHVRQAAPLTLVLLAACRSPSEVSPVASTPPPAPPAPEVPALSIGPGPQTVMTANFRGGARADRDAELARRLRDTRIGRLSVRDEPSLRAVVEHVATRAGVNAIVHAEAEEALLDAGVELTLERASSISAHHAFELVADLAGPDVDWTVRNGVVLFSTPERTRRAYRTTIYDIGDLLRVVRSRPAPEINVLASGGEGAPEEGYAWIEGEPLISEDALLQLIEDTIPELRDDPDASARIVGNKLIVRHP